MGCCGSRTEGDADEYDSILAEASAPASSRRPGPASAAAVPPPAAAPEVRVNQYLLVREIGHGSFGKVLMVQTHDPSGRVDGTFAMKKMDMVFLRKKMRRTGGGADEMVKREIATMKKLDHPNIARLVDVIDDEESRTMYVVSEYLPNGSLEEFRARQESGALALEELRGFVRQIVCALNYLHTNVQIAHRDIKPENIMLGPDNVAKLIDFGTAEVFTTNGDGSAMDLTSKSAGTPAFYAPEMCNIDIDEYEMLPTDVWALGVAVYQLAYGFLPYKETGLMQLMEEIDSKEIEYPPLLPPQPPQPPQQPARSSEVDDEEEALLDLLRSMLARDPNERVTTRALMGHQWVTKRNSLRFSAAELADGATIDVSPSDLEDSVLPRLHGIQSAAQLIIQLRKLRSQAAERIQGRQQAEEAEAEREREEREGAAAKATDTGAGSSSPRP
jgi:[calcium/calmodulin-dependent protein kinase] kinase